MASAAGILAYSNGKREEQAMRHTITNSQGSYYTDEERRQAVLNYAVLGNIKKVADNTGIPANTIYEWRNNAEWWDVLLQEVQEQKQAEIDAMYTGIIHKSSENLMQQLNSDDVNAIKPLDLIKISAIAFDKRQLVRNQPTSIRAEGVNELLKKLADGFKDISQGRLIEGEVVRD